MKQNQLVSLALTCCIASCSPIAAVAADPSETEIAERLNHMGCLVDLAFREGRLVVDRVRASGRISPDTMQADPLPQQLFIDLDHLHNLRSLDLRIARGADDRMRLRALGGFPALRELELSGKDIDDEVMVYVGTLTNLESLNLWNVSVQEKGLAKLTNLTKLKRLELSTFAQIGRRGGEILAQFRCLEYLKINGQYQHGALLPLKDLPALETVLIGGGGVNPKLLELSTIPSVQRIEIADAEIDSGTVQHLVKMENLKFLKLECCSIRPEAVQNLAKIQLQELECRGAPAAVLRDLTQRQTNHVGDLRLRQ